jgi:hypothetical protein
MLSDAFNAALSLVSFTATFERPDDSPTTYDITLALSNYMRNLEGPEEVVSEGREFIIPTKKFQEVTGYIAPKRGDRIISDTYGENVIQSIVDVRGLKGELMGFRVRTT